jgi:ArsR family transcriptional regulator, arsenate/arsenite/antimonite-responsive transcriptional repressor
MLLVLAPQNRAAEGKARALGVAFLYAAGAVLSMLTILLTEYSYPNNQHAAFFYKVSCAVGGDLTLPHTSSAPAEQSCKDPLDMGLLSRDNRNVMSDLRRYASRFAALSHEVRLQILRRLRKAHPDGMVVGEIQKELGVPSSTLSHHLEALLHEGLVRQREGRFLRYFTDEQGLEEVLHFLEAECRPRPGEPTGFGRKTAT